LNATPSFTSQTFLKTLKPTKTTPSQRYPLMDSKQVMPASAQNAAKAKSAEDAKKAADAKSVADETAAGAEERADAVGVIVDESRAIADQSSIAPHKLRR
jgi:hypothetical protein